MNYGLQLYSIRDITPDDFEGALKKVAEIGYKMVEPAGFFGHDAETVAGWLEKYGLSACGTHTGWQAVAEDFDATVKYHKTIGAKNIIIPGADLTTKAKLDDFIDMINTFQPKVEKEGLNLLYHNHSHEFLPNSEGIITHAELENRTKILFEIDTYWAFNAGLDPIELLDRLKDRTTMIHLKDGLKGGKGKYLGQGEAPVAQVCKKASSLGMDIVVESECLEPNGIEEVTHCFEFLKALN